MSEWICNGLSNWLTDWPTDQLTAQLTGRSLAFEWTHLPVVFPHWIVFVYFISQYTVPINNFWQLSSTGCWNREFIDVFCWAIIGLIPVPLQLAEVGWKSTYSKLAPGSNKAGIRQWKLDYMQMLPFQWNIWVWVQRYNLYIRQKWGWWYHSICNIEVWRNANEKYNLYPTQSDLHRDFTRPLASWKHYANHTLWDITCVFHGHDSLLWILSWNVEWGQYQGLECSMLIPDFTLRQ